MCYALHTRESMYVCVCVYLTLPIIYRANHFEASETDLHRRWRAIPTELDILVSIFLLLCLSFSLCLVSYSSDHASTAHRYSRQYLHVRLTLSLSLSLSWCRTRQGWSHRFRVSSARDHKSYPSQGSHLPCVCVYLAALQVCS